MAQQGAAVSDSILATEILAPTQAGANVFFDVGNGCNVCLRICGPDAILIAAETATVFYLDSGGTYQPLVDAITGAAVIAAGETTITIASRGKYMVTLTVTNDNVGLEIIENNPA